MTPGTRRWVEHHSHVPAVFDRAEGFRRVSVPDGCHSPTGVITLGLSPAGFAWHLCPGAARLTADGGGPAAQQGQPRFSSNRPLPHRQLNGPVRAHGYRPTPARDREGRMVRGRDRPAHGLWQDAERHLAEERGPVRARMGEGKLAGERQERRGHRPCRRRGGPVVTPGRSTASASLRVAWPIPWRTHETHP